MMRLRTTPLIGTTLIAVLMPMGAAAYVQPEQVLLQDAFINNFVAPPTTRTTDEQVAKQNETSKERREREQQAYFAAQKNGTADETLYGAAPEAEDSTSNNSQLTNVLTQLQQSIDGLTEQQAHTLTQRDQRALDRIAAQQETLRSGAPLDEYYDTGKGTGKGTDGKGDDGKGGIINSGAPLNESGPGSWVALALICGALYWTLQRAKAVAATVAPMEQDGPTVL